MHSPLRGWVNHLKHRGRRAEGQRFRGRPALRRPEREDAPARAQPVQLASLEVVTQSSSFIGLPQYVSLIWGLARCTLPSPLTWRIFTSMAPSYRFSVQRSGLPSRSLPGWPMLNARCGRQAGGFGSSAGRGTGRSRGGSSPPTRSSLWPSIRPARAWGSGRPPVCFSNDKRSEPTLQRPADR